LAIGERTGAPVFLAADGTAAGPARHLHRRRLRRRRRPVTGAPAGKAPPDDLNRRTELPAAADPKHPAVTHRDLSANANRYARPGRPASMAVQGRPERRFCGAVFLCARSRSLAWFTVASRLGRPPGGTAGCGGRTGQPGLMHEPTALARRRRWAASAILRSARRRATTSAADQYARTDVGRPETTALQRLTAAAPAATR
jgi:hypothetical protein